MNMYQKTINYGYYIANMRKERYDSSKHIRCDRKSQFGNPIVSRKESDRDKVCELYEVWFNKHISENKAFKAAIEHLASEIMKGKKLICWCFPKRCHTETIINYLFNEGLIQKRGV